MTPASLKAKHATPVATSYAELMAVIRATADTLPDDSRAGVALAEWRDIAPDELECIADHSALNSIPTRDYMPTLQSIGRAQVAMHGPCAEWGLVSVRYLIDGARGSYTVERSRVALQRLADRVATLPGARAVIRASQPKKPRPAVSWPAVAIRVFRQAIDDKNYADALRIASQKLGGRCYQCEPGKPGFLMVAPMPVDGFPAEFVSAMRDDGKHVVFDTVSGLAVDNAGRGSRKHAEEFAREKWQGVAEEKREAAVKNARARQPISSADALAEWCKARGFTDWTDDPESGPVDPSSIEDAAAAAAAADAPADALPDAAPVPADAAPMHAPAAPAQAAPDAAPDVTPGPVPANTAPAATGNPMIDNPASWVLRDKETGRAVAETFDRRAVAALNTARYEAVPIAQHLAEINRAQRAPADAIPHPGNETNKPAELATTEETAMNETASPCPVNPAAAPTWRYALVNRPAGIGCIPRSLTLNCGALYHVEPRPAAGQPHHDMARHGVLVCQCELTPEECRAYELAPLVDGGAALESLAAAVVADGMGKHAAGYVGIATEDPAAFADTVLHDASRRDNIAQSIGDPAALVARVLAMLQALAGTGAPCPENQEPAPADPMAADVAEWLAKAWPRLADDPTPRGGLIRAAKRERERAAALAQRAAELPAHEMAADWARNGRIALACAAELQARADALPAPVAPTREHLRTDAHSGNEWADIRSGLAEPDEYRAHVMEAMEAAKAAGLFYNAETYPHAAAVMAARWGYADLREAADIGGPDCDDVPRWFASHCYRAHDAIRAREERNAQREAREAMRLAAGVKLGALVFNDYKLTRSCEVVEVMDDGARVTIKGNRGARGVEISCGLMQVRNAIERAHTEKRRRDSYAEFCAARAAAAPVVAAEPEPAADEFPGLPTVADTVAAWAGASDAPQRLRALAREDVGFSEQAARSRYPADVEKGRYSNARAAIYSAAADELESAAAADATGGDAEDLNETRAALEIARALVESIDAAPYVVAEPRRAIRLLNSEALRLTSGVDHAPAAIAARYRMAAVMLTQTAAARDAALAEPVQAEPAPQPAAIVAPADRHEARGIRLMSDDVRRLLHDGWPTLPGRVLVMLRQRLDDAAAALALVPADWAMSHGELCAAEGWHLTEPAALAPVAIKLRAMPEPLPAGAWRVAPVAAGVARMFTAGRRVAGAMDAGGPTCYPWRTGCSAGWMAQPPPAQSLGHCKKSSLAYCVTGNGPL